ncbi:hypothetical protein NP493_1443g00037 [Ridgeia piscesae]|uniref:CUB domain-containing protein n=1 Tax=Ridgeia piscesae TaxID=27915 RepID=A0AAD9NB27_RIDPI|nr:hypothetical protein NP493_1443g00037 [Ridgeia piscesae]
MCIPTPTGRRCACPDGFNFVHGNKCSIPTYTCPHEYTAPRGRIQSPGHPGYKNNVHCKINVHPLVPAPRLFFYIEGFDLEEHSDFLLICNRSYLHHDPIYDHVRLQHKNTYNGKNICVCYIIVV